LIAAAQEVDSIETSSFEQRLRDAAQHNNSLLCIGLDPVLDRLPAPLRHATDVTDAIVAFNTGIIEATCDLVSVYKPNLAFYLAHGEAGVRALAETRRRIPHEIPVLLDAKVGDVGSTAEAYATAYFDTWGFDAVTVNPYLGEDSLAPFLQRADRGVIVVCKTSNPGSGDLQDLTVVAQEGGETLYLTVAARATSWSQRWPATVGLVVGATYPRQLSDVRARCPELPILLPGIGAQAGDLSAAVRAGLDASHSGLMVSASRAIMYAGNDRGEAWTTGVREAAVELRDAINAERAAL
jgi:orotidine-5'-phosphate decarboxylase